MAARTIHLVHDRDTGRIECGFENLAGAQGYIDGEALRAFMTSEQVQVFESYEAAAGFALAQRRARALAKLSPEDRKALGL